jgi:uncharacterized small protein (DUF1192 family)
MQVEPIDDVPLTDSTEVYIQDLENEITVLKQDIARLKKLKPKQQDTDKSCCEAYKKVVKNYHKLLDEIIPF